MRRRETFLSDPTRTSMNKSTRNLIVGMAGIAVLLIGVLVYAQYNAAHNYQLPEFQHGTVSPATAATSD
jgi:hypothetical protein